MRGCTTMIIFRPVIITMVFSRQFCTISAAMVASCRRAVSASHFCNYKRVADKIIFVPILLTLNEFDLYIRYNIYLPQFAHGPPQSTPSSPWFWIPSLHVSATKKHNNNYQYSFHSVHYIILSIWELTLKVWFITHRIGICDAHHYVLIQLRAD